MDENQEVKLPQEENTVQVTPPAKKKRTILIVSGCLLLAIILAALVSGWLSNKDKDPYELFAWGTKQEAVFEKLDKLNIDYEYDVIENELAFNCYDIQGSQAYGKAVMRFGKSGALKEIVVVVPSHYSYYDDKEKAEAIAKAQLDAAALTLTSKYGEPEENTVGKELLSYEWTAKTWSIYQSTLREEAGCLVWKLVFYKNS